MYLNGNAIMIISWLGNPSDVGSLKLSYVHPIVRQYAFRREGLWESLSISYRWKLSEMAATASASKPGY